MINIITEFLEELSKNNNREWFAANKQKYEASKNAFVKVITSVHAALSVFDAEIRGIKPQDCMFRIYRDVRFSKDKSPYKTNFGAYFNKFGKKINNAGYYFHIEPGNCFLSGGIYMPPPPLLKSLRQEVYYNFEEFKKVISDKKFKNYFGDITGDKLQRLPPEFSKDFAGSEYLKFKDYIVVHNYNPSDFSEKELVRYVTKVFKEVKPLNDFLNRAVS